MYFEDLAGVLRYGEDAGERHGLRAGLPPVLGLHQLELDKEGSEGFYPSFSIFAIWSDLECTIMVTERSEGVDGCGRRMGECI